MAQWIETVKAAIGRGREDYELAARTIVEAMAANRGLTQKDVAARIGMSTTWVCNLLKWYREGPRSETVFGPESAARRAAKRIPAPESSTADPDGPVYVNGRLMRDGQYWQPWLPLGDEVVIDGGPDLTNLNQPLPGEGQATVRVLSLMGASSGLIKALQHPEPLSRELLALTYQSLDPAKKRATLARLAEQLDRVAILARDAHAEVRAALKGTPRPLDDVETRTAA